MLPEPISSGDDNVSLADQLEYNIPIPNAADSFKYPFSNFNPCESRQPNSVSSEPPHNILDNSLNYVAGYVLQMIKEPCLQYM